MVYLLQGLLSLFGLSILDYPPPRMLGVLVQLVLEVVLQR